MAKNVTEAVEDDAATYGQRSAYVAERIARLAPLLEDDLPNVAAALRSAALESALYAIRQYEDRKR